MSGVLGGPRASNPDVDIVKLLFDQNLSFKLCRRLEDLFPDSSQVRLVGLEEADDRVIWQFARDNDFVFVTQDSDFADLSLALGQPPKVIWLRCGNAPTARIEAILRSHSEAITAFETDSTAGCLELY